MCLSWNKHWTCGDICGSFTGSTEQTAAVLHLKQYYSIGCCKCSACVGDVLFFTTVSKQVGMEEKYFYLQYKNTQPFNFFFRGFTMQKFTYVSLVSPEMHNISRLNILSSLPQSKYTVACNCIKTLQTFHILSRYDHKHK